MKKGRRRVAKVLAAVVVAGALYAEWRYGIPRSMIFAASCEVAGIACDYYSKQGEGK